MYPQPVALWLWSMLGLAWEPWGQIGRGYDRVHGFWLTEDSDALFEKGLVNEPWAIDYL